MNHLFRRLHEAFGHSIGTVRVLFPFGPNGLLYTCSCGKEWVD